MVDGREFECWDNGIIEKNCYDNDPTNCDVYGGLYDWDEMMQYSSSDNGIIGTTQGISPPGWHIPTDAEWKTLEMYLGMTQSEVDSTGLRGTNEGDKLKEIGTSHWNFPNESATNESGFTALPGGEGDYQRGSYQTGLFDGLGEQANFWTATKSNNPLNPNLFAWRRDLEDWYSRMDRYESQTFRTFSVRCVKD